jgi:PKD repeat protein
MASASVTIDVYSPVSATISGPATTCAGSPITLSAAGAAGDGIYAYMWSTGATTPSISPSPSAATTYTVTVTDGCGTTAVQSQAVTVSPLAVGSFTWAQTGVNTVTFTNSSLNGTSYSWDFGDGQSSTAVSPAHTYATNGTYTVVLTVTNSCGSVTTTQTVDVLLSLEDFLGNGNVTVFPNPSNGQFNVRFSNLEGKALNLMVFDLRGVRVHNQLVNISGQVMESPVDLSDLSKGMYFVQVSSGTERQTIKVIVE